MASKAKTKERPKQIQCASPEEDEDVIDVVDDGADETLDLRLNLDGLTSVSSTPRQGTNSSRTNLIVKANRSDIGNSDGDPV